MPDAGPANVNLERLGGEEGIERWVRRFYALVGEEPLLAPMFHDLEQAREKQQAYFVEFFGGPKRYTERYGRAFLRFKHRKFRIGRPERDAWMRLAMQSLDEALRNAPAPLPQPEREALRAEVEHKLGAIADGMINYDPERHDAYYFQR